MFVLRKITGKNSQMNFCLGKHYSLIGKNHPEFSKELKLSPHPEETYGVIYDENATPHFLYEGQDNYIMTSDGKTFTRLTN